GFELRARIVFGRDLGEGALHHFFGRVGGDHDDAVGIAENPVAARNFGAAAGDRPVALHHLGAALGVERADATVEDREAHLADAADVAHEAVGDAAGG